MHTTPEQSQRLHAVPGFHEGQSVALCYERTGRIACITTVRSIDTWGNNEHVILKDGRVLSGPDYQWGNCILRPAEAQEVAVDVALKTITRLANRNTPLAQLNRAVEVLEKQEDADAHNT